MYVMNHSSLFIASQIAQVSTMTDRLVEIERKDLPSLKNLYNPDGSKSYIAFTTIDNYMRWFEQDPNVKHIKVFCLNGDFSDGTFVLTVCIRTDQKTNIFQNTNIIKKLEFQDRCSAYADTLSNSYENLDRLLQLIDFSKGFTFLSIRTDLRQVIRDALQKAKVGIFHDDTTLLYHLPQEMASKFDVQ